jgi:subtilisin family serine protease
MSVTSRIRSWLRGPGPARPARRPRLTLELLEGRDLLSTLLPITQSGDTPVGKNPPTSPPPTSPAPTDPTAPAPGDPGTPGDVVPLSFRPVLAPILPPITSQPTPETVTLVGPDLAKTLTPTLTVVRQPGHTAALRVFIDVDLNGDGRFDGPGEAGYASAVITGASGTVTLPALRRGEYLFRARADGGPAGNVVDMDVDPDGGRVGSQILEQLAQDAASAGDGVAVKNTPPLTTKYHLLAFDAGNRVGVMVRAATATHLELLRSELAGLGMQVVNVSARQEVISGYLDPSRINDLPGLAGFAGVAPIYKPIASVGKATTQGDAVILGPEFRAATGLDGTGVTVGVISNSVSQFAGGLADSVATGDLPPNVNVLQDGSPGEDDEGRAMLEIVHDVAPGASLDFATGDGGPQNFAANILNLAGAGANAISDDLIYLDEPMFNDGIVGQAVDQAVAAGVFYTSAAGNNGNSGWSGAFQPTTATVAGVTGTFENFNAGGGSPNVLQKFTLPAGQEMTLAFEWDSAFLEGGSNLPNFQVTSDMDVLVTDATGNTLVKQFNTNNLSTNEAVEIVDVTNSTATDESLAMAFQLAQGTAPSVLKWVEFTGAGFAEINAQGEGNTATLFGHATSRSCVAAAAADWSTPTTPETYSAFGGAIPILFDAAGNRLSAPDLRNKPDVMAPDNVSTSFFIPGTNSPPDGNPKFAGTSAATPHVAAAAALLLAQNPGSSPAQITQALEATALDAGDPGFDFRTGFGLIQLNPAAGVPGGGGSASVTSFRVFLPTRYVFDAATGTYDGVLTLLNNGTTTFQGPLQLQVSNLPPAATVFNATKVLSDGSFVLPVTQTTNLVPGQVVQVPIMVTDPLLLPLGTFFQGLIVELAKAT